MKTLKFLIVVVVMFAFASCSNSLMDFTVVSSKNVGLKFDKTQGKEVMGKSVKFLGMGANIKQALDRALASAGPDYDILLDGRVDEYSGLISAGYKVYGTAVSSSKVKASLGKEGWDNWCKTHNIFNPDAEATRN